MSVNFTYFAVGGSYDDAKVVGESEELLVEIANARPCLDGDTTDADLAEWARTTIIPALEKAGCI